MNSTNTLNNEMINIWVIEDNKSYRESLTLLLNELDGFKCANSFETAEEAIETFKKTESKPSLILCDIDLPGMNGIKGVNEFKKINESVLILMLTVHDEEDIVFNAICAGADGYLLKSTTEQNLSNSIKEVLQGGAPINPRIAHKILKQFAKLNTSKKDYNLTTREKEVLQHIVDGYTKKEVASKIYVSYHTIDFHLRNIYIKLQVHSKSEAVAKALKERLL